MENPNNIRVMCGKHISKPDPNLHHLQPQEYIGCAVKIAFDEIGTPTSFSSSSREHMWVLVTGFQELESVDPDRKTVKLIGTLDNDPVLNVGHECGDTIVFDITEIELLLR